jgi:hypothetical protein
LDDDERAQAELIVIPEEPEIKASFKKPKASESKTEPNFDKPQKAPKAKNHKKPKKVLDMPSSSSEESDLGSSEDEKYFDETAHKKSDKAKGDGPNGNAVGEKVADDADLSDDTDDLEALLREEEELAQLERDLKNKKFGGKSKKDKKGNNAGPWEAEIPTEQKVDPKDPAQDTTTVPQTDKKEAVAEPVEEASEPLKKRTKKEIQKEKLEKLAREKELEYPTEKKATAADVKDPAEPPEEERWGGKKKTGKVNKKNVQTEKVQKKDKKAKVQEDKPTEDKVEPVKPKASDLFAPDKVEVNVVTQKKAEPKAEPDEDDSESISEKSDKGGEEVPEPEMVTQKPEKAKVAEEKPEKAKVAEEKPEKAMVDGDDDDPILDERNKKKQKRAEKKGKKIEKVKEEDLTCKLCKVKCESKNKLFKHLQSAHFSKAK